MVFYTFPIEVIEKIIEIVEEDNDLTSLYYLCLTNKTLCQITIPYLWKKSLNIKKFREGLIDCKNVIPIISTLLSFIKNTNIKHFLKKNYKYIYYIPSNPLFNYPSFIKQLDFGLFIDLIGHWINSIEDFDEDEDNWEYFKKCCGKSIYFTSSGTMVIALVEIIFRTIIKNTDGLEVIIISTNSISYDLSDDFCETLFRLEDSQRCLKKLRKLVINDYNVPLLNQTMSCVQNLTKISTNYSDSLMSLLVSQRNLKNIKIYGMKCYNECTIINLKGTISPLLESLKLVDCEISDNFFRFFKNCNRLKKLEISDADFILPNQILEEIIFPDLEELKIIMISFQYESEVDAQYSVKQFFIHHIKNLKKLETLNQLKDFGTNFVYNIPLLLSENNLTHLSLQVYNEQQIYIVLEISKNIEELTLINVYINTLSDQYLEEIILRCNKNLKVLDIKKWEISISGLKILLTQKRLCLKKLDCFIKNGNSYHVERLIQKYKEFNNRIIRSYTKKDTIKDCYGKEEYCKNYGIIIEWD